MIIESIMKHGKRGAAYVGVGVFEVILGFVLALKAPGSMAGFATILGAINVPLYGGGMLAKWADCRVPVPPVPPGPLPDVAK